MSTFTNSKTTGKTVYMYRDVDRLEKHLTEISPEDAPLIHQTCRAIRRFGKMDIPIDKPVDMYSTLDNLKMLLKMLPVISLMKKYGTITVGNLSKQFKHLLLQEAFSKAYPDYVTAYILLAIFSSLNSGDSGIPVGGSKKLATRIEQKYLSLGGKIHYNSAVDKIEISSGKAIGVILKKGGNPLADIVVSSADGNFTLQHMLQGKYVDETLQRLYSDSKTYPTMTNVIVSAGVACDLSKEPHMSYFKPSQIIDAGGITHEWLGLKHYCYDKTFAPQGKSVIETAFLVADYDWWRLNYQDKELYKAEKERLAKEVCVAIEEKYPQTRGKIEKVDVATPMTYERFCNAWRGSFMSWAPTPESKIRSLSGKLKGLRNFYMTGQWTMLPGINGGVITGKWVIQRICKDLKVSFKA